MRERLAALKQIGGRHSFTATIGRYDGLGGDSPVTLLLNVRVAGERKIATDHLWCRDLALAYSRQPKGARVSFTARIRRYFRPNDEVDYCLHDLRSVESLPPRKKGEPR